MYMFTRSRHAAPGHVAEAFEGAVAAATKVHEVTGHQVYTWSVVFGQPAGTVMWSTRLDSQAQLIELDDKLAVDPGMTELVKSLNQHFDGPLEDQMARLISGTPSPEPKPFIAVTQATMANGKYTEAVTWGVEMQQFVGEQTGLTTAFAMSTYGGYGDVVWLLGADSMSQLDDFDEWRMGADGGEFRDRIEAAGDLFVAGSGQNGLIRRLA